ncbi:response regulator transcription factor [[Clostridium] polysaccharolyticum]|uniref:Stage 0 sporulation protein A homolog n=1 Tax=[Clostridium] polysaccharolyticum TaxID=29364 RepID=A0A1I0EGX5_9FIRM|nr:response regulator transcription factor [[Clostridium] polysaccharolyticum]SET44498.1 DNA-binding response regulator, OmpR family, contains REC and winged-helix (wHTH) domain [[Clostridium] polysaccharolyticum]
MNRILIVEDEKPILNLLYINLRDEGYECACAMDGLEAADLLESRSFDLVLLDIMIPKIDGYELLDYIKPVGTPVIMITAMGRVDDKIKGLKKGADDYIVKPFQIGEVLARVEAILRRVGKTKTEYHIFGVYINTKHRIVKKDNRVINLTVKEFDLLVELVENKNIALYREQLYEKIWNEPFTGETRTLDSHIQRLRKKLNWEDHIKTIFRIGYRLEV